MRVIGFMLLAISSIIGAVLLWHFLTPERLHWLQGEFIGFNICLLLVLLLLGCAAIVPPEP